MFYKKGFHACLTYCAHCVITRATCHEWLKICYGERLAKNSVIFIWAFSAKCVVYLVTFRQMFTER